LILLELLCHLSDVRWVAAALSEIDCRDPEVRRAARPAVQAAAAAFGTGSSRESHMVFHVARSLLAEEV
jgi:hypothetical protein